MKTLTENHPRISPSNTATPPLNIFSAWVTEPNCAGRGAVGWGGGAAAGTAQVVWTREEKLKCWLESRWDWFFVLGGGECERGGGKLHRLTDTQINMVEQAHACTPFSYTLTHGFDFNDQQTWVFCVSVCAHMCVWCRGGLLTPCLRVEAWFIRLQMRCNREGEPEQAGGWLFVYLHFFFHSCSHSLRHAERGDLGGNHQLHVRMSFTKTNQTALLTVSPQRYISPAPDSEAGHRHRLAAGRLGGCFYVFCNSPSLINHRVDDIFVIQSPEKWTVPFKEAVVNIHLSLRDSFPGSLATVDATHTAHRLFSCNRGLLSTSLCFNRQFIYFKSTIWLFLSMIHLVVLILLGFYISLKCFLDKMMQRPVWIRSKSWKLKSLSPQEKQKKKKREKVLLYYGN